MKCHYEVLGVPLDVNDDDLKKSYRKLALKWHPDKNLDNEELAKEQFQLVQQAYEILSDPQERSWYDRHRDAILKGGLGDNYQDNSLDVFPYFTTTCFKGYGDDTQGFYSVYREVFNKLITEDLEFVEDPEIVVPKFGSATSDYEETVHPFYAYWQSYSTKKTYSWLDPYDIRDTPNRRVLRLVEKENKKIREKAKKERNEEVRNLVAFVRKRDPRVKAWGKVLEQRAQENAKKTQEKRQKVLKERHEKLKSYKEEEWSKFSNIEKELKTIEQNLAKEFNDTSDLDQEELSDSQEGLEEEFYCPACNKVFKTEKSFSNHEKSKKHKENVELLKATLLDEENNSSTDTDTNDVSSEEEDEENEDEVLNDMVSNMPILTEPLKPDYKDPDATSDVDLSRPNSSGEELSLEDDSVEENISILAEKSKKQRKKQKGKLQQPQFVGSDSDHDHEQSLEETIQPPKLEFKVEDGPEPIVKKLKGKKAKEARKQKKLEVNNDPPNVSNDTENVAGVNGHTSRAVDTRNDEKKPKVIKAKKVVVVNTEDLPNLDHYCAVCKSEFPSKNKLFDHLKKTGHSVFIPEKAKEDSTVTKTAKGKSRKHKA